MIKRTWLVVFAALGLVGCDANAIKFAQETKKYLEEYQKKLAADIADARGYYQRDAALKATAAWRRLNDGMSITREERSAALGADYLDGKKSPNSIRNDIRDYVLLESEQRRQSLSANVDATLPYLERLTNLEADKEKVAALAKVLESLAKPRTLLDEAKEIKQFVDDTKTGYNKLVCDDLKAKQKTADSAVATNTDPTRTAVLKSEKDTLDKLIKDRNCSATPAAGS